MENEDFSGRTILMSDNERNFTDSDVRNIFLELENAALFALSHKLNRTQLRDEFKKIKMKWKIFPFGGFSFVDDK